jgi:hypothetical protein
VRRTAWWAATGAVGVPGLLCGCLLLGPMASALLAAVSAVLGATAVLGRRAGPPPAVAAVAAAAVPLAVLGLLDLLGVVALLPLGVLAVARPRHGKHLAPAALVRWLDGEGVVSPPAAECVPEDPLPPCAAVPGLPTDRLCLAWRVSYVRLQGCRWPGEREHLAELRRCLAEELERRDPGAFRRWLPTARAGGDPGRFFLRDRPLAG